MTNTLLVVICILLIILNYSISDLSREVIMIQTLLIQRFKEDNKPKKRRTSKSKVDELQEENK